MYPVGTFKARVQKGVSKPQRYFRVFPPFADMEIHGNALEVPAFRKNYKLSQSIFLSLK